MIEFDRYSDEARSSIRMLDHVARRLGADLLERFVFVGGAILPLLVTDPDAGDIRATRDVDIIVEAVSYGRYVEIGDRLRARGLFEDASPGAPICRWVADGVTVDVMPTEEHALGFSNRWYPEALATASEITLPEIVRGQEPTPANRLNIRVVSAPVYVATKLEAFLGRGNGDLRASYDIEDVVTLMLGRPSLVTEIASDGSAVIREFITGTLRTFTAMPRFDEIVEGHLSNAGRNDLTMVLDRIEKITRAGA